MLASVNYVIHCVEVLWWSEHGCVFEQNVIYLKICVIVALCQVGLKSMDMECAWQTKVGDLLVLEQSLLLCHDSLVSVYCTSILCVHSWCLLYLNCQQRVFLNCHMLPNDSCQCMFYVYIADICLVFNLDAITPSISHFKPVFLLHMSFTTIFCQYSSNIMSH